MLWLQCFSYSASAHFLISSALSSFHVPAWLGASVAGTSMTARTAVAEAWRSGRMAEWQARRVSGLGLFPLFSSSTCFGFPPLSIVFFDLGFLSSVLLVSQESRCACCYQSTGYGLQSSNASIAAPLVHVLVYLFRFTIIQGMRLLLHRWCMYWSIRFVLQSFKGYVYCCTVAACIDISVSVQGCVYCCTTVVCIGLSVLVYNHPRDEFITAPLAHVSVYQSKTFGLQSSEGCVYCYTAGACITLSVLVYSHPKNVSIAALVPVSVYQFWSTIIQGMRLLVERWCMYWSIGLGPQLFIGCVYFCTAGATLATNLRSFWSPGASL